MCLLQRTQVVLSRALEMTRGNQVTGTKAIWRKDKEGKEITYSALGTDTAVRVDPDVLRHGVSLLVELHVLHELWRHTC